MTLHMDFGEFMYENKLIHRDLHIGNILYFSDYASITDLGLCEPANYIATENSKIMSTVFYHISLLKF
jgi:serine/threonine protein kinase